MSDNRKEAEEKMAKAIFISADCWLSVFDLLTPSKLGFGIAMISHQFDYYVDEHFKTRKWTLALIRIRHNTENLTTKMAIFNSYYCRNLDPLPIPQIQMPRKVIGFKCIEISFIDQNAIAFLNRFHQLFAACPINLNIETYRFLELIVHNIWPMIATNIHGMQLSAGIFHHLRKFVPSILNECPSLRVFTNYANGFYTEFPCDDNAMASNGQAVAKWLFTPRPDNVPKVLKCFVSTRDEHWGLALASRIEALKAAFANASSAVNFIVVIEFHPPPSANSVELFDLTNELTREQLTLKKMNDIRHVLLIRCPIVRDESKWAKWEEEAIGWDVRDQWNRIEIPW